MTRFTLAIAVHVAACAQTAVFAAPSVTHSLEVQSGCSGNCAPMLVELGDGKVVALWASMDGQLWAQSLDATNGALLGSVEDLGFMATAGGPFAQLPMGVALPDGDLALIGLLRDGRVTYARGSEDAARRVPPKVIVPGVSADVLDIAAGPRGPGTSLLVLRAPDGYDPKTRRPPADMHVELYALEPTGDSFHSPLRWTTAFGSQPRVATCEGQSYVVWESKNDVVVTIISAEGQRAPLHVLSGRKTLGWLGSLACQGADAILTAAWQPAALASQNTRELSFARIAPASTKLHWKTVKLPEPPRDLHVGKGRLASQLREDQLYVSIGSNAREAIIRVPLETLTVDTLAVKLPAYQSHCLASPASSARAVCAASKSIDDRQCTNSRSRTIFSFVGYEKLARARQTATFWQVADPIPGPQAPSASELSWRRGRVMCGEPGWSEIRQSLEAWCSGGATDDDWRSEPSLCARDLEHSLLYQVIHCTNEPVKCEPSRFRVIPSVDRTEFEKGNRIELSYLNCSIIFAREAEMLRVKYGECTGE